MDSLSLVELKKMAQGRGIKQYYIMRRAQLLQLLAMPELPLAVRLEKKTIQELRQEAKQKGMRGFWRLHREELLALLYPNPEEHNQNQGDAQKHHQPQRHDAKHVGVEVPEDPLKEGSQNMSF